MQKNKNNEKSQKNVFTLQEKNLRKGQRIIYEGEVGYVLRVKPLLVIKTRDRIICSTFSTLDKYLSMEGNKLREQF